MNVQPKEFINLYEVLEIPASATPEQVRSAYLKLKSAYSKDSIAMYSLAGEIDTREILNTIEHAYSILSDTKTRKEYDRDLFGTKEELGKTLESNPLKRKVVSIDRVPPMDSQTQDELLIAPATDFDSSQEETFSAFSGSDEDGVNQTAKREVTQYSRRKRDAGISRDLEDRIQSESHWSGAFLREIREEMRISIEEMSEFTKVSKTYLRAIEDEQFHKLPAVVYLRGFITQIAKKLRLPHEKVTATYIARYKQFLES